MLCQATKSTLRARTTTGAETGSRPSWRVFFWMHDEQQKCQLLDSYSLCHLWISRRSFNTAHWPIHFSHIIFGTESWDPNRARWHQRCQAEDICPWLIVGKVWKSLISSNFPWKIQHHPLHHWKPSLIQRLWQGKPTHIKQNSSGASIPTTSGFLHPAIDPRFSTDAAPCATTFKTLEASWAGKQKETRWNWMHYTPIHTTHLDCQTASQRQEQKNMFILTTKAADTSTQTSHNQMRTLAWTLCWFLHTPQGPSTNPSQQPVKRCYMPWPTSWQSNLVASSSCQVFHDAGSRIGES